MKTEETFIFKGRRYSYLENRKELQILTSSMRFIFFLQFS